MHAGHACKHQDHARRETRFHLLPRGPLVFRDSGAGSADADSIAPNSGHSLEAETEPRERARLHVCWGNYEGPHDCDVPLETIWPLICQANVGGFVLPFANARHAHEFKVLGKPPLAADQVIVAMLICPLL